MEYTKKAFEDKRVKIFAICFGHQILARALGARVGRNTAGWELAVCEVDLTETGKQLFGRDKLVCVLPFVVGTTLPTHSRPYDSVWGALGSTANEA